MTDQKWRSPTGHPIASHETDKSDFLTRGQLTKTPENVTCGDVSNVGEALDDYEPFLKSYNKFINASENNPFEPDKSENERREFIDSALNIARLLDYKKNNVSQPVISPTQQQPDAAGLLVALDRVEAVMCHEVCSSTNKKIADSGELCRSDISKIRSFLLRPVDLKELKKKEYHNLKVKAFLEQEEDDGQTKRAEQKGGV